MLINKHRSHQPVDWMCTVNGEKVKIKIQPDDMLVDVLRDRLGLTGTKVSCREGECGSCTVWLDGRPVNSCLVPALKAMGREVVTIEGLGSMDHPHPVQAHMAETGAVQCGFCTPGFVMTAAALLRDQPGATKEDIREGLSGNLCRCSGYVKIIQTVEDLVEDTRKLQ